MNKDIIYREDAIKAINLQVIIPHDITSVRYANMARNAIRSVPTVDRPQGEWIYGEHDVAMCDGYRCDRCGFFVPWDYEHKSIDFINDYKFCPSCGCRMKGADDEGND